MARARRSSLTRGTARFDRGLRLLASARQRGLRRSSVAVRDWLSCFALLLLALPLLACSSRRELREWQPSDHQPPPEVVPEGQGEAAEEGDPNQRAAAALWGMRCASCHGTSGRGDGAARPPGAGLPDLTQPAYQASRSDEQLHAVIKTGRGMMPAFGDQLSDLGIAALVEHVRSLARSE